MSHYHNTIRAQYDNDCDLAARHNEIIENFARMGQNSISAAAVALEKAEAALTSAEESESLAFRGGAMIWNLEGKNHMLNAAGIRKNVWVLRAALGKADAADLRREVGYIEITDIIAAMAWAA